MGEKSLLKNCKFEVSRDSPPKKPSFDTCRPQSQNVIVTNHFTPTYNRREKKSLQNLAMTCYETSCPSKDINVAHSGG